MLPRVDVYVKPGCSRSVAVRKAMAHGALDFNVYVVDNEVTKNAVYALVRQVNPVASSVRMPVIVVDDEIYMDFDIDEFMSEVWTPLNNRFRTNFSMVCKPCNPCRAGRLTCAPSRLPPIEVFAKKGCRRCSDLIKALAESGRQPHVYLTDYEGNREALWQLLDEHDPTLESVDLPVIVVEGKVYLYCDIATLGYRVPNVTHVSGASVRRPVRAITARAPTDACGPCDDPCSPCPPTIKVFSKQGCNRCVHLQDALAHLGLGYELFDLVYEGNTEAMWDLLNYYDPGMEKVNLPVVVINNLLYANFESMDNFIHDILLPIARRKPPCDQVLYRQGPAALGCGCAPREQIRPMRRVYKQSCHFPAPTACTRVSVPVLDGCGRLRLVDADVDCKGQLLSPRSRGTCH
uniref:Glutaredoxin domain-containing protein n=1 Tax=Chromera velia CCMP2878 TaxID=1169474 RepID=A0A0G4H119_9ALVE|eukprot:Cvel_5519.t1-p1 / transcript=Cvel_5519.t1 / gene=Cvel_5519 / organism=Chromera_velia_CCMP2878 / gene_product=hypothetical protein / transcript_product=hypothetical protein / location=Cvel_scaffold258:80965-84087(-) / protein_length=404 / sequence_SO=supercontig / SO=protein_coding / is_pseudo=false